MIVQLDLVKRIQGKLPVYRVVSVNSMMLPVQMHANYVQIRLILVVKEGIRLAWIAQRDGYLKTAVRNASSVVRAGSAWVAKNAH